LQIFQRPRAVFFLSDHETIQKRFNCLNEQHDVTGQASMFTAMEGHLKNPPVFPLLLLAEIFAL
jgi:hypothetical protein